MKITWIPEENHVAPEIGLMKITGLPEENHVSTGFRAEENHDRALV